MKRILLYIFFTLTAVMPVFAWEQRVEHHLVIDIPFHVAQASEGDIRYDIDSVALAHSLHELQLLSQDTDAVVKSIEFYSSVSPEGTVRFNKKLGRERLETAERIVRSRLNIDKSVVITRDERYIPWHDYLLPTIKADVTVPYRDELIELIYRPADAKGKDNRRVNLKRAKGGALWRVVEERYFDYMRKGGAIITVERTIAGPTIESLAKDEFATTFGVKPIDSKCLSDSSILEPVATPVAEPEVKQHAVSIKMNAAAVAALITNIGFEVKLAPRWSLDVMGAYSPYNMIVKDRKIRVFGARPEVRFWWGTPMKRGHFLGLHGFTSAFNIQLGDKARYQDPNHALWGVGLAYGYALPLDKKERWGVEFTLGLGYSRIKYDKYDGAINGQFIERKLINYFGPTRLGVNFSYRFDIEGKNKKKR